eukprot:15480596-Alexandrium_andersonii.AAC.1
MQLRLSGHGRSRCRYHHALADVNHRRSGLCSRGNDTTCYVRKSARLNMGTHVLRHTLLAHTAGTNMQMDRQADTQAHAHTHTLTQNCIHTGARKHMDTHTHTSGPGGVPPLPIHMTHRKQSIETSMWAETQQQNQEVYTDRQSHAMSALGLHGCAMLSLCCLCVWGVWGAYESASEGWACASVCVS